MDKFETWLMKLVDHLEGKRKTTDRVYKIVYEFGHDIGLEILHHYRKFEMEKNKEGGS